MKRDKLDRIVSYRASLANNVLQHRSIINMYISNMRRAWFLTKSAWSWTFSISVLCKVNAHKNGQGMVFQFHKSSHGLRLCTSNKLMLLVHELFLNSKELRGIYPLEWKVPRIAWATLVSHSLSLSKGCWMYQRCLPVKPVGCDALMHELPSSSKVHRAVKLKDSEARSELNKSVAKSAHEHRCAPYQHRYLLTDSNSRVPAHPSRQPHLQIKIQECYWSLFIMVYPSSSTC